MPQEDGWLNCYDPSEDRKEGTSPSDSSILSHAAAKQQSYQQALRSCLYGCETSVALAEYSVFTYFPKCSVCEEIHWYHLKGSF